MRLRFYVDFWPGCDAANIGIIATTKPPRKLDERKRIAFDVEIPEKLLFDVDAEITGIAIADEEREP